MLEPSQDVLNKAVYLGGRHHIGRFYIAEDWDDSPRLLFDVILDTKATLFCRLVRALKYILHIGYPSPYGYTEEFSVSEEQAGRILELLDNASVYKKAPDCTTDPDRLHLNCLCEELTHTIEVSLWTDGNRQEQAVYIQTFVGGAIDSFWGRLLRGVCFVLGRDTPSCCRRVIILPDKHSLKLRNLLCRFTNEHNKTKYRAEFCNDDAMR